MRRLLLACLLLFVSASALGQVRTKPGTGVRPNPGDDPRRPTNATVMYLPLTQSGVRFAERPTTLAHFSWDGRGNYALQSENGCTSPWVKANAVQACTEYAGSFGAGSNYTEISTYGGFQYQVQTITVPSSTSFRYQYAVQVPYDGGVGVLVRCPAGTGGGTCTRSDGKPCVVAPSGTDGIMNLTDLAAGAVVTVNATLTCSVAATSLETRFYAGSVNGTGVMRFGALNVTPTSAVAGPYVRTFAAANGLAAVDSRGNSFYPAVGPAPFVPPTALPYTAATGAVGPFTSGGRYTNGLANDAFDAADFHACAAFVAPPLGTFQYVIGNGNGSVGYTFEVTATGQVEAFFGATSVITANTVVNGPNVACFGRSGTTGTVVLNDSTPASAVVTASVDTARAFMLATGSGATSPFLGELVEVVFDLQSYSDAWSTAQTRRHFGMIGPRNEVISVTRAGPGTELVNGTVWTWPAGMPRVTSKGLLVEATRSNYAINNTDGCATGNVANTGWAFFNVTCSHNAINGPDGTLSADQYTQGALNGGPYYASIAVPSTTTLVSSTWGRRTTAGFISSMIRCSGGTPTTCTCVRSDGGACTPVTGVPAATDCSAKANVPLNTWVRVGAVATCSLATTSTQGAWYPGEVGVTTTDSAYLWGAQVEVGTDVTSTVVTAGTAVSRPSDQVSVAWPTLPVLNNWCVVATGSTYQNRPWGASPYFAYWDIGTTAAANSARALIPAAGSQLSFRLYDDTATLRNATQAHGFADGSTHTLAACNTQGTLRTIVDGALFQTVSTGGTGLWTAQPSPQTLFLGGVSSAGAANGYLSDLRVCKTSMLSNCR